MATYTEANQARLDLKIKLSTHFWYNNSAIVADGDGYSILIHVRQIDNNVRKIIPNIINSVEVRTYVE